MKVLVICGASLKFTPYAFGYLDEFLDQKSQVTAIVWRRDGHEDIQVDQRIRLLHYDRLLDDATPKVKKIGAFFGFRHILTKELNCCLYDFVVVLDTQFAVLISDVLMKKYRGRFIYDMRDPSYEGLTFYRKRVAKIVEASAGVFISSDGYRRYLPDSEKIHTTHNIRKSDLVYRRARSKSARNVSPLRISFWGCVRDRKINEMLIDALGNDERFVLQYFGTMSRDSVQLIDYCRAKKYDNVVFFGKYLSEERVGFAMRTDIIHNIYSNSYDGGNPCMGNKYYDGLIFAIPQICLNGGFMGHLVQNSGLGVVVSETSSLGDTLWDYYHSIDWTTFETVCDRTLEDVITEYDTSAAVLREIISKQRKSKT